MYCTKCGGETKFVTGVGKTSGKPYEGWKCTDSSCGNLDFVQKGHGKPRQETTPANNNNIVLLKIAADLAKQSEIPVDALESCYAEVKRVWEGKPRKVSIMQDANPFADETENDAEL